MEVEEEFVGVGEVAAAAGEAAVEALLAGLWSSCFLAMVVDQAVATEPRITQSMEYRKWEEYCFERENSPSSLSFRRNSVTSLWHTHQRLRAAH